MTDAEEAGQRAGDSSAYRQRSVPSAAHERESYITPAGSQDLAEAESTLIDEDYVDGRQKAMAESLARRQADQEFLKQLAVKDFTGTVWDYFSNELAAYGIPILMSWTRTRKIVKLCAEKGRPISAPPTLWPVDERNGIVSLTIAKSINVFRDRVLRADRWDAERGATIKTYFMGAVILQFPNFYNSWLHSEDRSGIRPPVYSLDNLPALSGLFADQPGSDPGRSVVSRLYLVCVLEDMPDDLRKGCLLMLEGYTMADAGRRIGKTPEAFSEQLRRYRSKRRREM